MANSRLSSGPAQSLQAAVRLLRTRDGRGLARAAAERTPPWLWKHGVAHVYELQLNRDAPPSRAAAEFSSNDVLRDATLEDLLSDGDFTPADHAEYSRRIAAGERCCAVFHGSHLAHFSWLHEGPVYVRGPGLLLDWMTPTDAYIYDVLTKPRYRGCGLYQATQLALEKQLTTAGFSRIVQIVEAGNEAPLYVLPRLGYQRTQTAQFATMLGIKRTVVTAPSVRHKALRLHWQRPRGAFCV